MAETPLPLKDKLEINVPRPTPAAPNAIPSNQFSPLHPCDPHLTIRSGVEIPEPTPPTT
jgi:hypothetical protein